MAFTYRNIGDQSPSTRRAWIEIALNKLRQMWQHNVALHPEGVDRNSNDFETQPTPEVALHPEGVDRNFATGMIVELIKLSPSTRRAWIEIFGVRPAFAIIGCRPPPGGRG